MRLLSNCKFPAAKASTVTVSQKGSLGRGMNQVDPVFGN